MGAICEPCHVVLVHGTYGIRSSFAWPEKSAIVSAIQDELGSNCTFHRFQWSGRNLQSERTKASQQLASFFNEAFNFNDHVILIGHSHGGNIILEASQSIKSPVYAVFLGTPFLSAEEKGRGFQMAFTTISLVGLLYLIWITPGIFLLDANTTLTSIIAAVHFLVTFFFTLYGLLPLLKDTYVALSESMSQRCSREQASLEIKPQKFRDAISLSYRSDEAIFALKVIPIVLAIIATCGQLYFVGSLILAFVGGSLVGPQPPSGFPLSVLYFYLPIIFITTIIFRIIVFIYEIFYYVFRLVMKFLVYGVCSPKTEYLLNLVVSRDCPLPKAQDIQLNARAKSLREFLTLSHSRIYDDQNVIENIVSWMRSI